MEDVLELIKNDKMRIESVSDLLFECLDNLESSIKELGESAEELETKDLIARLLPFVVHGRKEEGEKQSAKQKSQERERMAQGEYPTARQDIDLPSTIQVKIDCLDTLMKLAEELLIGKMRLDRIREDINHPELSAAVDSLSRNVTDLQYNIMQARMVPIGTIFNRFPRMVRDLAKQEKKEIDLTMEGEALELDRSVLDQIGEPLVHLLRNAVDHGIEMPEVRKKAGKTPLAVIKLSAARQRDSAVIVVSDDGMGLQLEKIKAIALKRGIIAPGASADDVFQCIFSGLSTAKEVTQISGRGLGLNIVKKKIEAIGGSLKVESKPGLGTRFAIELPLTLAIVATLFVRVGKELFAIPLSNIERLVTARDTEIHHQLGGEAIILDGEDVPVVRLSALFGMTHDATNDALTIVVVRDEVNTVGLAVDSLLTTQEVVIKPLNRWLRENRYFSGSTIIGSGEVVLILDIASLVRSKTVMSGKKEVMRHVS
jgi:two-component system chemotaxis sensor kinase CheA